ncbi:MAG TPA: S-methyl-5'-thioadenosine phosphorylase [Polyangiaceae bacterium]|nr:S-methyl-5'-thioadenosine phosphorylase [Polyangiaceae bacterium]
MQRVLAVIGGSGVYDIPELGNVREHTVDTPFGSPSDAIIEGTLGDVRCLFLPRHGRGHHEPPHQINYRANICALKKLGAEQVVSVSAVGSMRDDIHPGDVVVVDQYIDLTKRRESTFFEDGVVAHVSFADPVCPELAAAAGRAVRQAGGRVHAGGTYVCIEGPQFSTRAESHLYRSWGVSVIGMTAMPEAKLAREAELPYATLAFATDYDCWHDTHEAVSVEAVVRVLQQNSALAKRALVALVGELPDPKQSPAARALSTAILTPPDRVATSSRARLDWLLDPYLEH